MADAVWTVDYSNFKWSNSDESCFVVLNNNTFTLYSIVEGQNGDLRKQDIELSEVYGTLAVKDVYPCDSHHHRKYKNFIVHPSNVYDIVTSCQQKLYLIDLHKGDSKDILNLSTERRQVQKRINLLDWNSKCQENIALSIEKFRTAKGILITDIKQTAVIQEFGSEGEGVQSMAWSPHSTYLLVAGTSKKRLELFDMRGRMKDSGRRTNDIQEIDGACFSPKYEHIFASHSDEYVKLWDCRYLKNGSPVDSIKSPTADICKIEWCPTHPTRLSYITKGGKHIQIRDFPATTLEKSDGEQTEFTGVHDQEPQHKQKGAPEMFKSTISNFSWHPKLPNRILCCKKTLDDGGNPTYKLYDIALYEAIIAKFSPTDKLVWGCAGTLADCAVETEDISDLIKQRICSGYGFDPSLNKQIVGSGSLHAFWSFFESVKKREEENDLSFKNGVVTLLESGNLNSRRDEMKARPHRYVYISAERSKCLEICSWPTVHKHVVEGLDAIVRKLISTGEHYKAVAMTLFYSGVDTAIALLQDIINDIPCEDDEKRILLFALSGFSGDEDSLWNDKIKMLGKSVSNPYQRAMFTFLTTEVTRDDSYTEILRDRALSLEDRIAFACRFLSDSNLRKFVNSQCSEGVLAGNIRAVVLTGVKHQLKDLLQSYLDKTSDVQTVCIALSMAKKYDTVTAQDGDCSDISNIVLDNYLRYFDMRCMWIERALFENERKKLLKNKAKIEQHLLVRCSCSKSISDRPSQNLYNTAAKQPPSKETLDKRFCPSKYCKSKLPRCALCMYHLGTTSRFQPIQTIEKRGSIERRHSSDTKSNPLKEWFVWCLVCQHGGHSGHIEEWFAYHKLCPYPGCKCNCAVIDMAQPLESAFL